MNAATGAISGTAPWATGTYPVTVTVSDGHGGTTNTSFNVTVRNSPPVWVNPPADQRSLPGTSVNLSLTGRAADADDDVVTYSDAGHQLPPGLSIVGSAIVGSPSLVGVYTVTLTASDGFGGAAAASFTWNVSLNQPPICSTASASPNSLWPPNGEFVPIQIASVTDPDQDPLTIKVTRILQDEPTSDKGDDRAGHRSIDAVGIGTSQAQVRSERSVKGDGRVYEIHFAAGDDRGATCAGVVRVGVPRNQRVGPAVDSGVRYDSTATGGSPPR